MPKVFIIILNWKNWPDVLECLASIRSNDYPNYQVVIVDNDSGKKPAAPSLDWPAGVGVKMIYNQENLGFSGGNNVGIKYALENGADYVLLLNDDTIVDKSFLTELVKAAESAPEIGLAGPKIYFHSEPKKLWDTGGRINWLRNKGTMRGHNAADKGQYDLPAVQETDYIDGCCLLIKKEAIDKIGLLPEDYVAYYEDVEWSFRARRAGYKCVFAAKAKIWHKGSKSTVPNSPAYIYYHVRNGLIFAGRFAPWYIQPFVHLDALGRVIKQIIKLIFLPSKRDWAKYTLIGIKDFYFKKFGKYEDWH